MILQNIETNHSDNKARFVIENIEHAALAVQLTENFGNKDFASPEPNDEILYLAAHHDHGWESLDEDPPVNEEDGLPYNLIKTLFEFIIKTSKGSPDYNEKHSLFCGLISSMYAYGLYNGRYGLSDAINMDWIPEESRADVDSMLADELNRQNRLKKQLAHTSLGDDKLIFSAYKFLQFIDACALYFNMNPAGQRGKTWFRKVPKSIDEDVGILLSEVSPGHYCFTPYPFSREVLSLYFEGRYLERGASITATPISRQYINIGVN